ncbi:MAG: thiolase family protein [Candidatus Hodarchaeota archaeon]
MRKVAVIGVGLHRYGKWDNKTSYSLAKEAIDGALKTSNLKWNQIQSGWCGHIGQGMTAGARLFLQYGKTGLSITNVENASASGSYAFRGAYLEVASGEFDIALALGIDKRHRSLLKGKKSRDSNKVKKPTPVIQKFAKDARNHMKKYGTTVDQLAMVSVKNHYNGSLNRYAQFQEEITIEDVHNAPMMDDPLTILHCTSTSDGAAACILASEDVVKQMGIINPVWVAVSVSKSEFDPKQDPRNITAVTAREAYKRVGIEPSDLGLVELHDAFTIEEIFFSEQLGLCPIGEGGKLVEEGATAINGRIPINTSGGLLAMGHPIGPTGIGQIAEVYWQMRGEAGKRQIPTPPKYALTHMIGFGGTCIIHIFSR